MKRQTLTVALQEQELDALIVALAHLVGYYDPGRLTDEGFQAALKLHNRLDSLVRAFFPDPVEWLQ